MASSSATHTVEVDVIAKGLKGILKELEGMGAAVESTGKKQKEANKSSQDLYDTQAKGIIGTANSTKSFSKLSQTIGSGSSGLVGVYATLAANAFAVSAAFNTLREAAKVEQVLKGIEVQGARTGRTLTVAASQVQELTNYSLSYADSLRSVAQVTAAGFGTKELQELTKVATNTSIALGRNIPDSMDRIVKGVTKLEPELLDELGIMTKLGDSSAAYARANGKTADSLTSFEKRQGFLNAVLAEGALKFGGLSESVKPSVYDQVAATFDNLVKSLSNIINIVGKPFAAIFATSQLGLLGLGALFLSTVRDQILPGYSKMAEAARKAANEVAANSVQELKFLESVTNGRRRAANEYIASVKTQTATMEQFNAAIAENTAKQQFIADRPLKSNFTEKTRANQAAAAKAELDAMVLAQYNLNNATIQGAKANAVAAVSEMKLSNIRENSKVVFESIGEYYNKQVVASGKGAEGFNNLGNATKAFSKTAVFSLQLVGQATLQLLPYIGLAIAVVGALQAAWEKYGRSDVDKAKAAALAEVNEIVGSVNKKLEELVRIQNVAASGAQVTQQALILQANATLELTSSYLKLADAIAASEKAKEKKSKPVDELDPFSSKVAFGTTGATVGAGTMVQYTASVNQLTKAEQGLVKEFQALAKLNPVLVEGFYKQAGGFNAFAAQTDKVKFDEIYKLMGKVDKAGKNLAPSIDNLTQTFKSSEATYQDFVKSISPTTPYDSAIKGLKATTSALKEVEKETKNNVGLVADYTNLLANIGPEMRALLSTETRGAVQNMESLNASIQNYKSLGSAAGTEDKKNLQVAQSKLEVQKEQVRQIRVELETRTKTLEDNQQAVILDQSRMALGQAHLSLLQKQDSITGEGLKRQMQQENSIKAIQIEGLKLQKNVAQIKVDSLQADLTALENQRISYNQLKDKEKLVREIAIIELQSQQAKLGIFNKVERDSLQTRIDELKSGKLTEASEAALKAQETSVKGQINLAKAGVIAISNNMKAIGMGMTSTAEQNARADLVNIKNAIEIEKIAKSTLRIKSETASIETKIAEIAISKAGGLSAELRDIKDQAAIRQEDAKEAFKNQERILLKEIDIQTAMGKGGKDAGDLLQTRLNKLTEEYTARTANIDAQERLNILEKVGIKNEEDRIALFQKVLDYKQKLLSNNTELLNSELALRSAERSLESKRTGTSGSEAGQKIEQIDAAKTALKIAQDEAVLKKAVIKLEYQLLAYQHMMMMQDLKQKKQSIDAQLSADFKAGKALDQGLLDTSNTYAAVITAGAEITVQAFIEGGTKAAQAVENGVKTAATKLEEVLTKGPRIKDGFVKNLSSMQERAAARTDQANGAPVSKLGTITEEMDAHISNLKESLSALGPEGELVLAVAEGAVRMSKSFQDFGDALKSNKPGEAMAAGLQLAADAVGTISSILKAGTDAKIANIDREIAAEQKRDGKSASSVAKIAEMEKKKDTIARKSFETQKKLQMAQTVISTAAAIAGTLGSMAALGGPAVAIPLAVMMGALGAAQLAIIAGTSYQGAPSSASTSMPSTLSIGKQSSSVDLAKGANANAGGEVGFLRGSSGQGSNASNYRTIGSAYGGELVRGYGSRGFVVGEKGPERINMDTPITVSPVNDNNNGSTPINANINIHAMDSSDVQRVLVGQKGNIIKMLREAANASGKSFMEDVNVNVYTRPGVNRL